MDDWQWDDAWGVWINVWTGEIYGPSLDESYDYDWADYAQDEAEYQDSLWDSGYYG